MSSSKNKLKLLCDENLPHKLVELLKTKEFDVERAPFGSDDAEVAELAKSENRVILTFDRHFGNTLLFPPEEYSGIVFIRIRPPLIQSVFSSLLTLFKLVKSSEFKGKLFTLSLEGFRVFPRGPK